MDSSNKMHDCSDVISKVSLALDGELSDHEAREFLVELKRCSFCLDQYQIEQSFKEFLCNKIQRRESNPGLANQIRMKIAQISIE